VELVGRRIRVGVDDRGGCGRTVRPSNDMEQY
jgi:hypothetical protein